MSESYCPFCKDVTSTSEEILDSSYRDVCSDCGAIIEDSPIQGPGSAGEDYEQRESNKHHWTLTLSGSSGNTFMDQKNILLKEDSAAGLQYRRSLSDKNSPLYSANMALITSLCEKLNLDQSLRRRIMETWYSIRGSQGLKKVLVERDVAQYLGAACLYWICRKEGMTISPARLSSLAGVNKGTFLRASIKVEKVLGFPVSDDQLKKAILEERCASLPVKPLSNILEKLQAANSQHADQAEMLAQIFRRFGIVTEGFKENLPAICAYFLVGKFDKKRGNWSLERFFQEYSVPFSTSLQEFERRLYSILVRLAFEFTKNQNVKDSLTETKEKLHDFVSFFSLYSLEDLPLDIQDLLK